MKSHKNMLYHRFLGRLTLSNACCICTCCLWNHDSFFIIAKENGIVKPKNCFFWPSSKLYGFCITGCRIHRLFGSKKAVIQSGFGIKSLAFPFSAVPAQLHQHAAQTFVRSKGNPNAWQSQSQRNRQQVSTECGDNPHGEDSDHRRKDGVTCTAQSVDDNNIEGASQLHEQVDEEQRGTEADDDRVLGKNPHQWFADKQCSDADAHGDDQ